MINLLHYLPPLNMLIYPCEDLQLTKLLMRFILKKSKTRNLTITLTINPLKSHKLLLYMDVLPSEPGNLKNSCPIDRSVFKDTLQKPI